MAVGGEFSLALVPRSPAEPTVLLCSRSGSRARGYDRTEIHSEHWHKICSLWGTHRRLAILDRHSARNGSLLTSRLPKWQSVHRASNRRCAAAPARWPGSLCLVLFFDIYEACGVNRRGLGFLCAKVSGAPSAFDIASAAPIQAERGGWWKGRPLLSSRS